MVHKLVMPKLVMPLTLAAGIMLAGSAAAEARDGCGPGFHRGYYGWCRPNLGYRPFVYGPAYPRFGYRYGWYRGGYRHARWPGGRGWHRHW